MSRLERRCRALLRAYPAAFRAERGDEVLATLLDANEGRRAPRLGDALDVVGHGLATRVRRWPGSAAAALWADAAAVALVAALTVVVAFGIALLVRWGAVLRHTDIPNYETRHIVLAHLLGATGVATLGAVYAARERLARRLVAATAAGTVALGTYVYVGVIGADDRRGWPYVLGAAIGGGLLVAAVSRTDAVARAAVVPRAAWGVTFTVTTAVALGAARLDLAIRTLRAPELLALTYAVAAPLLLVLALPFRRREPRLAAAAALLCLAATPVATILWRLT
jgi:hypothetical protein